MTTELLPEQSMSLSLVPYDRNDNRAIYLSFRTCGFNVTESLTRTSVSRMTLCRWRKDTEFKSLEKRIPEFRKELSSEYLKMDFIRNYRLVLQRDFEVINKSLQEEPLTHQEQQYLVKARSQYTPQQLQIVETLASSNGDGDGADFLAIVKRIHREDTLIIKGKDIGKDDAMPEVRNDNAGLLPAGQSDIV